MRPRPETCCRWTVPAMLLVAACAVALTQGCTREEPQGGETYSGTVIARVNGKPIYEEQLKPELEATLQKFRKYGMQRDDPALIQRRQSRILDRLIGEQLIYQESQKLTIENIDERVEQELKALQVKYGTGEHFDRYLQSRKLSRASLRESLRARVQVAEYLKKQGIADPEIPEARIREAYDKNPETYVREESIKVSHILIAVSEDSEPAETDRLRQEAERIRKEILEGGDFAELARKHSKCNSASGGGDLGYIKKAYMPPEFDQVAFSMDKDSVSDVVKTKFGFHLIRVSDKKPAGVVPFEEVSPMIKKYLQEEETRKKLATHIAGLKEKASIEIQLGSTLDT